jgi:undecaprenyl phosphate-alpha-L-ara4FN deformylase
LKLALKIDADTLRATREGVPKLVEILNRHEAGATFFFGVGPDHGGFMSKVLRGLPVPDIGRRCADVMRATRDAGFEVGLHAWDSARWRARIEHADADWTAHQLAMAMTRYEEIFGERASVHAAPGWRMNKHAFRATQALAFDYACDTRGTRPFIPILRAEIVACPQVPVTLPTLDELFGRETNEAAAIERLLAETAAPGHHHVFSLRAIEGVKRPATVEKLLEGWRAQGYTLVSTRDLLAAVAEGGLPMHSVTETTLPGRKASVAIQGPEFLPELGPGPAPPGARGDDLS